MTGAGHNSQKQVRSILERILRLKEEQDELGNDIKEIYAEAKSNGYDKTALGLVVTQLRKQEKDPARYAELTEQSRLYMDAYVGTEVANIERAHTPARDPLPNPGTTVPKDEPDLSFRDEDNGVVSVAMNDALVSEIRGDAGEVSADVAPAGAAALSAVAKSVSAPQAAGESGATNTDPEMPDFLRRKSA